MNSVMIHLLREKNTIQKVSNFPLEDTVALRVLVFRLIDANVGHISVSFAAVNESLGSTTL